MEHINALISISMLRRPLAKLLRKPLRRASNSQIRK